MLQKSKCHKKHVALILSEVI